MKRLWLIFLICLALVPISVPKSSVQAKEQTVKNVIFMIPDGFSSTYATGYRWYKGKSSIMDDMLVGMHRTYSASSAVTDSAAGGTAMATGVKTNNGMIAMSPTGEKLPTILQAAKASGKKTGLVTTTTITYATPAAFASHVENRKMEAEIAPQLIDNKVDVLFGGGRKFFPEKLQKRALEEGYQMITDRKTLSAGHTSGKLLGLFADGAMSPELDRHRTKEPSLTEMTEAAIKLLQNEKKGFFLMVEGGQIDWAGHANDAAWAMKDIEAFEQAVKQVIDFAAEDQQTLVVIAGDHNTGGMSIGGYNQYAANIDFLRNIRATGQYMVTQLNKERSNSKNVLKKYANIVLTPEEQTKIQIANDPQRVINQLLSKRALIGWTTYEHTGVDVPVYAYGPGAESFNGLQENTDLPKKMAKLMKISLP
ncbi:alkaline phosphatase [Lederbergia galactosidilyticus]|uniref:alkaline phosphatase n=1 Tax=Lederbergia galactosidilytica TaxID=217031 RepID=UPI001AE92D73|nr:alkaline phosphatase [Lederbergia galactosidilytica]MBP1914576.1 alkaline phosphatase [Lederbergia galactosidilytica]